MYDDGIGAIFGGWPTYCLVLIYGCYVLPLFDGYLAVGPFFDTFLYGALLYLSLKSSSNPKFRSYSLSFLSYYLLLSFSSASCFCYYFNFLASSSAFLLLNSSSLLASSASSSFFFLISTYSQTFYWRCFFLSINFTKSPHMAHFSVLLPQSM